MSEKQLLKNQEDRIMEIKKQWADEMCLLFDKWEEEERLPGKNGQNETRILDGHLKETVAIERKYKEMIRQIEEEQNGASEKIMG